MPCQHAKKKKKKKMTLGYVNFHRYYALFMYVVLPCLRRLTQAMTIVYSGGCAKTERQPWTAQF
jgi:hypothetical protein